MSDESDEDHATSIELDKYRPFRTFLSENWKGREAESFFEKRKAFVQAWKELSVKERKSYDREARLDVEDSSMKDMTGPDEPALTKNYAVYRVYYDGSDQWWENIIYLSVYFTDHGGYTHPMGLDDAAWPWYSNKAMLVGITPQNFYKRVYEDRYDFNRVGYDVCGGIGYLRNRIYALADEETARTGMLQCCQIEAGETEPSVTVRLPAWRMSYCKTMMEGEGHMLEEFPEQLGCEEEEEIDELALDLRQPIKDLLTKLEKRERRVNNKKSTKRATEAFQEMTSILKAVRELYGWKNGLDCS